MLELLLLILTIAIALAFGFTNGMNDAANVMATPIGTRAMTPKQAVIVAGICNFVGAITGTSVALTIGKGIVATEEMTYSIIIGALSAVVLWGVIATRMGRPISLTHSLVSALAFAGVAVVGFGGIKWSAMLTIGLAVICAPLLGFIAAAVLMVIIYWIFHRANPAKINAVFARGQWFSSGFMAYAHGKNDGQGPVGIIMIAFVLFSGDAAMWVDGIPIWIKIIAGLSIASGMAIGGWQVIKTLGMKVTNLRPVQGFTAQVGGASIIELASWFGIPVSTTHCITSSVMGVGAVRRLSAVRWGTAKDIILTWLITFPVCGILGFITTSILNLFI